MKKIAILISGQIRDNSLGNNDYTTNYFVDNFNKYIFNKNFFDNTLKRIIELDKNNIKELLDINIIINNYVLYHEKNK